MTRLTAASMSRLGHHIRSWKTCLLPWEQGQYITDGPIHKLSAFNAEGIESFVIFQPIKGHPQLIWTQSSHWKFDAEMIGPMRLSDARSYYNDAVKLGMIAF